ncbi:MAG: hypothetical protein AMJ84_00205 [Acidithiobacillales bacterium SM23_46]|nr:MAG: hypothetical protein AMJ84_00205 [Acidithiobacillales bacterium SM23_46]KPL29022.1 MAG: hypothetical protein AMJ72_00245 [Acidithiobacillales bacterium SM1_46]
MTVYYNVTYSNRAGGSFVEEGAFVTWNAGADSGFIVSDIPGVPTTTGKLAIAIIDGSIPPDAADTLTQGAVTADVDTSNLLLYPAYLRDDVSVTDTAGDIDIAWTGPAIGATHSFLFDGQTSNVVAGEILTFSGGQQAEVITVVSDAGATGELDVRFITEIDTFGLPVNNDTFTGDIAGDGTVNGEVHPRGYTPLELHRFLSDLNDDETIAGDDDLSMIDPTATDRQTDQIIRLLGLVTINDTVAQHMYGGSVEQGSGNTRTLYSGLGVQVTTPLTTTRPILIQEDAIITDYWNNAYFPDSVSGKVRILVKTIENGVAIDGQRIKGKLLEYGESYFEGFTTVGTAETSLALFSSGDSNNNTAAGTVAGAPYNTIVVTEGYQTLDFNEGSGPTPFGLSIDFGSASALQTYERTKYIQRRGTAETLFGRNAQLFTGFNRNFAYDGETANLTEPEVLAYGTEIPYTGGSGTLVTEGEVVEGAGGARGRVIYVDDTAGTGTIIVADPFGQFNNTEAITTLRGAGEWTATTGTVVNNTASGQILLLALDDQGTTGNVYGQQLTGVVPLDNQTLFGKTSGNQIDVNGAVATRTINNQFVGNFTGTNFQTNFGIAIDPSDAIAGDSFPNLLEVTIQPPDNRSGTVTNLVIGDRISVYPWDGASLDVNGDAEPNFDEMTITAGVTGGVSTTVVVGAGNIPNNTPAAGFLRLERDSDGNYDLLEYSSYTNTTGTFTLVGTAPNTATIGNNLMRALIDKEHVSGSGNESYTATWTNPGEQVAVTVRRGGSPNPIKTFKTTTTFGPFSVSTIRTPDE